MKMKLGKLALVPIAAAAMAFSMPAAANTVTFQGVTFASSAVDVDTMMLTITGAPTTATGDWSNIDSLAAFSLDVGGAFTSANVVSGPGAWTFSDQELNAGGCAGGASGKACFTSTPTALTLSDPMSWNIDFVGGSGYNFDTPGLKVLFLDANGEKAGSLFSAPIPEPETYAMLLAGLGLMGLVARRRRRSLAS